MTTGVELSELDEATVDQSVSHLINRVTQFLRVVRYRINVIVIALLVVSLLGGLYYATATRYYQASAEILILQNGNDAASPSMGVDGASHDYMPTYEQLLRSAVVLREVYDAVPPAYRIDFEGVSEKGRVGVLSRNLTLNTVRKTNIIRVHYRSKDPEAAVAVVNALLDSYFKFVDRTHESTAIQITNVLKKERDELAINLEKKEQELLAARQKSGDIGIGLNDEGKVTHHAIQRLHQFTVALAEAEEIRRKYQGALTAIQAAIRNGANLQQHLMAVEETVGRAVLLAGLGLSDRDVRAQAELERDLLKDRSEADSLSRQYGRNHPRLQEVIVRIQMRERYLREYAVKIQDQLSKLQNTQLGPMLTHMMEQALANAQQQENNIRTAFLQAQAEAVQLNGALSAIENLEHEVERMRNLHNVLIDRIASVDLKQQQGDIRATVTKDAIASGAPVSPRFFLVAVGCLFLGLFSGGLIIFIQDALDDRFRSPDDVTMRLGVPTLAMVAQLESPADHGLEAVQAFVSPNAPETEAFRTLRTALSFNADETRQLVVSSAEPGDGKTTMLANLGVSIAQSGKKVLMIDADLRRPGLTNLFAMKKEQGLSDILRTEEDVAEFARKHVRGLAQEGLDILPSGPRRPDPAELLTSQQLGDLLAWAETHYDQILIDSPPVLAASDVMLLGRMSDGVVLVINPDKNHRRIVTRAFESLHAMKVNVLGVVANRIDAEKTKGYGYGYGYSYSYQYGESDVERQAAAEEMTEGAPMIPPPASVPHPAAQYPPAAQGDPAAIVPRKVA